MDNDGVLFTKKFASKCAREGYVIVSGGAKGVDSLLRTLLLQRTDAISIVSNNLNKKIKEKVLEMQLEGRLLVMSTVNPDAHFTVYRAMDRNKYIMDYHNMQL